MSPLTGEGNEKSPAEEHHVTEAYMHAAPPSSRETHREEETTWNRAVARVDSSTFHEALISG